MKGVAIAFETIIYVILAVLVLTVLLYFFTSQATPAQNQFQLLNDQREGCVAFARQEPQCGPTDFPLATKLKKACDGLNTYPLCKLGSTAECFKQCCSGFCRVL